MVAAVIAAFAVLPSVDALICGGEGLPSGSAPAAEAAVQADHAGDQKLGVLGHADGGVCAHGHCHHGTVSQPSTEAHALTVLSLAERMPIPMTSAPAADPHYSLHRPPRA